MGHNRRRKYVNRSVRFDVRDDKPLSITLYDSVLLFKVTFKMLRFRLFRYFNVHVNLLLFYVCEYFTWIARVRACWIFFHLVLVFRINIFTSNFHCLILYCWTDVLSSFFNFFFSIAYNFLIEICKTCVMKIFQWKLNDF